MSQYTTTNVRLPTEDWKQLKQEAILGQVSLGEIFRGCVHEHLQKKPNPSLRDHPLLNLDKFGFRSGFKNTSRDLKKIRVQMLLKQNKIGTKKKS